MSETEMRRYRFGPLERRGLIGSLRATQVIPMAVSLAAAVVLMRALPGGGGGSCRPRARPRSRGLLLLAAERAFGRGVAAHRGRTRLAPGERPATATLRLRRRVPG